MALPATYGPEANDSLDNRVAKISILLWNLLNGQVVIPVDTSGATGNTPLTLTSAANAAGATIAAGAKRIVFVADTSYVGNVDGVAFPANGTLTLDPGTGYVLPAVAFTRSAGTLYTYVLRP